MERVSAISKEQAKGVINNKEKYILIANGMKTTEKAVEKSNVSVKEM